MIINIPLKLILIAAIVAASITLYSCGASEDKRSVVSSSGTNSKLQGELEKIKEFNGGEYRSSIDALLLEVTRLNRWALIADAAEKDNNSNLKPLAKEMKNELEALQLKEFPAMRQAFADLSRAKLGAVGIGMAVSGKKSEVYEMVSPNFTSNMTTAEMTDKMESKLNAFRFKQVAFKLFKTEKPVRSYALKGSPDSQIGE